MTNAHRAILAAILIPALASLAACGMIGGGGGGGAPGNAVEFVLEDATSITLINIGDILNAESVPARLGSLIGNNWDIDEFQDELRDDWDEDSNAFETDPESVRQLMAVGSPDGGYVIVKGNFNFEDIKAALEDEDYDDGTYREREIWEDGGASVALFEGSGIYVVGASSQIKKILRALDQGDGFMESTTELRQALDRAQNGALAVAAAANCSGTYAANANGCRAAAIAITGGNEDTTLYANAAVFSSERRAETALDDIEEAIEDDIDNEIVDMDINEIQRNGEIVTFRTTRHE